MFIADEYVNKLIDLLQGRFGKRLAYVGLQGSYLRNEANENSDIDIMVVIDGLTVCDMDVYRGMIESLEDHEKSCGFICGTEDLRKWNSLEICHLLHTTEDRFGKLSKLVPSFDSDDMRSFVKLSLGNLYHELCHRYIHSERERNVTNLPFTYKAAFFILQDIHYFESGEFINSKHELKVVLKGKDRLVLETAELLAEGSDFCFDEAFELLFSWCKETLERV